MEGRGGVDKSSEPPHSRAAWEVALLSRRRVALRVCLAVVVVAAAVGGWIVYRDGLLARPPAEVAEPQSVVEDALIDPELLRADPPVAEPGDVVELHFATETNRGVMFVLERQVDTGWHHEWLMLTSADPDGRGPASYRADEAVGYGDISITGPGPDLVEVPRGAHEGDHRICEDTVSDEALCVELTVQR